MKTIILPGYSEKNREWALEVKAALGDDVVIHQWAHWSNGKFFEQKEIEKIESEIASTRINIIAKSVGVSVLLSLTPQIPGKINKIILCGIASVSGEKKRKLLKEVVSLISPKNILCIQNEGDSFVKFSEAKKFYHSIEPRLNVLSKSRSDHKYPFYDDFRAFLRV